MLASPAQGLQPLSGDSPGPPGRNKALSRKQGDRFSSEGEGARHERVDKTPGRGRDLAGGGWASSRETLRGFPCGLSKAHSSAASGTSSTKKRMRKIKNNYPPSWFGPKRLSSIWFAKALLSHLCCSSREKDEVINVCVQLFQMIVLRMLSFLFISSFSKVLLRTHCLLCSCCQGIWK